MAKNKWENIEIRNEKNEVLNAISPLIISASRSTDIPAFHAEWFMKRLKAGYIKWINPFNQKPQYVSFKNTKVIVFWSKNPEPLMKHLKEIDDKEIKYYFHFTINDYEKENFEPNVPDLDKRIDTFKKLSKTIGGEKVIWRFDPLTLNDSLTIDDLVEKIYHIGEKIHEYTEKLVFSFIDIDDYRKVNKRSVNSFRELTDNEKTEFAEKLIKRCEKWKINFATCAEGIDLDRFKIKHNKCIDDELILKITKDHAEIKKLFGIKDDFFPEYKKEVNIKDKGQRKECLCVFSKDIGQYNTCSHLCMYCYANLSKEQVEKNMEFIKNSNYNSESIIPDKT